MSLMGSDETKSIEVKTSKPKKASKPVEKTETKE